MKMFRNSVMAVVFTFATSIPGSPAWAGEAISPSMVGQPGSKITINPQPEPPGKTTHRFVAPWVKKGFNPQPEPPAQTKTLQ